MRIEAWTLVLLVGCKGRALSETHAENAQPRTEAALDADSASIEVPDTALAIVEKRAALRERLRLRRQARHEKQEFLKLHTELTAAPAVPDLAHRPAAPAASNLPPQLFGAPLATPVPAKAHRKLPRL